MHKIIFIVMVLSLSGCAAWQPRVANPDQSYTSHLDGCIQKIGGNQTGEAATIGAGAGALVGLAIAGFTEADAALTAGMGAALAGSSAAGYSEQQYRENLLNCLRRRGYEVYP